MGIMDWTLFGVDLGHPLAILTISAVSGAIDIDDQMAVWSFALYDFMADRRGMIPIRSSLLTPEYVGAVHGRVHATGYLALPCLWKLDNETETSHTCLRSALRNHIRPLRPSSTLEKDPQVLQCLRRLSNSSLAARRFALQFTLQRRFNLALEFMELHLVVSLSALAIAAAWFFSIFGLRDYLIRRKRIRLATSPLFAAFGLVTATTALLGLPLAAMYINLIYSTTSDDLIRTLGEPYLSGAIEHYTALRDLNRAIRGAQPQMERYIDESGDWRWPFASSYTEAINKFTVAKLNQEELNKAKTM